MSIPTLVERETTYDRFAPHIVPQPYWGWAHAVWFTFMGLGAGLFLVRQAFTLTEAGTLAGLPLLDALGIVLVAIGGLVLIGDLGRSGRVLKAFKRPDRSWIARGAWADLIFLVAGALYIAPAWFGWLPWSHAPWLEAAWGERGLIAIAALSAGLIVAYPGMVMYEGLSIRLWRSALVPAQFIAHALTSSLGLALGLLVFTGTLPADPTVMVASYAGGLVAVLGLTHMYVVERRHDHRPAAVAGLHRLLRGPQAGWFWASTALFVVALALAAVVLSTGSEPVLAAAGLLSVPASLTFRYAQLKAGVKTSPII